MQTFISTQSLCELSIREASQWLEAHWSEPILLQDVAAHAHLSPYHFHRIFKTFTQTTAKQLLTRLRLEKAAQLLRFTDLEIAQIAMEVGYENHETFTRAFKNHFGQPPSDYRSGAQIEIAQKQAEYSTKAIALSDLQLDPPKIVQIAPVNVVYIRHTGSYDQVGKTWNQLLRWALLHWQLSRQTSTLGIVHDDPYITQTEQIRYDACLVVKKEFQPKGSIGFKQLAGGKYAVFRYKGAYDNFYTVYDYIYSVILLQKGWQLRNEPALEWYIQSPPFYKPDNFLTDFYLPIE
ncbi:MAG: GyrI-like domain-containing protein [Saprospiraceae bacterium]